MHPMLTYDEIQLRVNEGFIETLATSYSLKVTLQSNIIHKIEVKCMAVMRYIYLRNFNPLGVRCAKVNLGWVEV